MRDKMKWILELTPGDLLINTSRMIVQKFSVDDGRSSNVKKSYPSPRIFVFLKYSNKVRWNALKSAYGPEERDLIFLDDVGENVIISSVFVFDKLEKFQLNNETNDC